LDAQGTHWRDGPLTLAVRHGAICYLDEIVEARQDTLVIIHPLSDARRALPLDKKNELVHAHPDFLLVISYNPGYPSNGRHQAEYQRFKDLEQPWSRAIEAQLNAASPKLSTRMGAALRQAGATLRAAKQERRLLLLLTDGEPPDIDAPDPRYLREDARYAVAELKRQSIQVFAISLDPAADTYVRRIFGDGRFLVLERIESLPHVLPKLYDRIAR
jgi:nitric oxide reductase activation protein